MKNKLNWTLFLLAWILPLASLQAATYSPPASQRVELNFNADWLFKGADPTDAQNQVFDDAGWASVGLPHTTKFVSPESPKADLGVSWYRKHFVMDNAHQGKKVFVKFGAAMQSASVYLNGSLLTQHVGGFTPITVDVTTLVNYGGAENVIAVRTDNRHSTDWAPGQAFVDFQYHGGLYRNVRMIVSDLAHVTDAVHAGQVASGGVFVTTPNVTTASATVNVKTHVQNDGTSGSSLTVVSTLTDAAGTIVQTASSSITVPSSADRSYDHDLVVATPQLWHPHTPTLYTLHTEVRDGATTLDYVTTKVGIRHIEWTHSEGLKINGSRFNARGANFHQEIYGQGFAMPDRSAYYDVKRLKEAGFDYVRSAHYPHSPAFYDACDELGVLVMNSLTGWQYYNDSTTFKNNTYQECRDMIRRDRNHPSIIVWETSLNEANLTTTWAQTIHDIAHAEYPGDQMYTTGWKTGIFDVYGAASQHNIRTNTSETRPMIITEYGDWDYGGNTSSSRVAREGADADLLVQCNNFQQSLDANLAMSWFSVDGLWQFQDSTGYLESTTKCGVMDHYRLPKFSYYFYQSQRDADVTIPGVSTGPMAYIANTWKSGSSPSTVRVFSNCEQVSIYVNNSMVETRSPDTNYPNLPHPPFTFNLGSYTAGTVRVDGLIGGSVVATHSRTTPGTATQITLTAEGTEILAADGGDARLVFISALDANGQVVADSTDTVNLSISGNGQIVGPTTVQMKAGQLATWVRAGRIAGTMTLTATGNGLTQAQVSFTTVAVPGIGALPAPSTPTGLVQTGGGPSTVLTWNDASGAWSYNVKRSTTQGGPYTTIATVSGTEYSDTSALQGTTYYYVVSGGNEAGSESADSSESVISAVVLNNLSFENDTAQAQITAKAANGFDASGNDVDAWLNAGTTYNDSGVDIAGNGGLAVQDGTVAAFCSSTDDGAYQVSSYILQSGDQVTLTWWAKSTWNNAGQSVSLLRGVSSSSNFATLTTLATSTDALTEVGNGGAFTQYTLNYTVVPADVGAYLAVSFKATGSSAFASFDDFNLSVTSVPPVAPAIPTGLTAISGDGQISLSWDAVTGADSYTIYRSEIPGGFDTLVAADILTNGCVDITTVNETTYYYAVVAVNAFGNSDFSQQINETPSSSNGPGQNIIDIPVENASFELPGTTKQFNWSTVPDWNTDTQASDSGVEGGGETSEGNWAGYLKAGDPKVGNLTDHVIVSGEWLMLKVYARALDSATLEMSLYYDDNGSRQVMKTYQMPTNTDMCQYHLMVKTSDFPAAAGKLVGIELANAGAGWMTVDNVSMQSLPSVSAPMEAGFGDVNVRYWKDQYPGRAAAAWSGSGWKGERVNLQMVLYTHADVHGLTLSAANLNDGQGGIIDASNVKIQRVRYMTAGNGTRDPDPYSTPTFQTGDMLEVPAGAEDILTDECHAVWVTVEVPADAVHGSYQGSITVSGSDFSDITVDINLDVIDMVLPPSSQWDFHLDLWQNPWAVARYENVIPWSQAHIDKLRDYLIPLAEAGQKVITTTLIDSAWGGQTYDSYGSMIQWTKNQNNSWSYDYTIFDQYVELCDSVGISEQINCYSMVAWGNNYQYYDVKTSSYQTLNAAAGSQDYDNHWGPFLQDFRQHLITKGWIDRAIIAMDERTEPELSAAINLVKANAPEIKIALAGHYFASLDADVYDWCPWVGDVSNYQSAITQRASQNNETTFYTMTWEDPALQYDSTPNNFVTSPPVEQVWDGWFAAAKGLDGYLRWALNSWGADPLNDTRNPNFQPGDAYQIYPGPRTSIRFERLREGIQDYEKIRILRSSLGAADQVVLENTLSNVTFPQPHISSVITDAKVVLRTLSENVANGTTGPIPQTIAMTNASFEVGAAVTGLPSGWALTAGSNSDLGVGTGGSDGTQFLWIGPGLEITQDLGYTLSDGETLTLQYNSQRDFGRNIQLLAKNGGTYQLMAETTATTGSVAWDAIVLNYTVAAQYAGQELAIGIMSGAWNEFDNFELSSVAATNNAPVASDDSLTIAEDAAVGASVGTVVANDPDAGDSVAYAISAGDNNGDFNIDAGTGEITTAKVLDYETLASYNLTVTVTDPGGLSDPASITITVTDVQAGDDSGGNALNDNWEVTHFGSVGAVTVATDTDGDGLTTYQEMVFGGNPNAKEVQSDIVQGNMIDDNGTPKMEFKFRRPQNHDSLNVTYHLQTCNDLQQGSWANHSATPSTTMDGSNQWVIYKLDLPSGVETRAFYRCLVSQNP